MAPLQKSQKPVISQLSRPFSSQSSSQSTKPSFPALNNQSNTSLPSVVSSSTRRLPILPVGQKVLFHTSQRLWASLTQDQLLRLSASVLPRAFLRRSRKRRTTMLVKISATAPSTWHTAPRFYSTR